VDRGHLGPQRLVIDALGQRPSIWRVIGATVGDAADTRRVGAFRCPATWPSTPAAVDRLLRRSRAEGSAERVAPIRAVAEKLRPDSSSSVTSRGQTKHATRSSPARR